MTDAETKVREAWDCVETNRTEDGRWYFFTANPLHRGTRFAKTREELFEKGATFTEERLQQIAEVEEEIAREEHEVFLWPRYAASNPGLSRILSRLQAALSELKRGMR